MHHACGSCRRHGASAWLALPKPDVQFQLRVPCAAEFPAGTIWGIPGSGGLRLAASKACVSPLTVTPPDSPLPPVEHLRVEVDDGPVNDDILATQFPVE